MGIVRIIMLYQVAVQFVLQLSKQHFWSDLKLQLFCSLLVPAKEGFGPALKMCAMGLVRYMEVAIISLLMENSMTLMGVVNMWLLR